MYLLSLYFDEKTNKKIQSYMNYVADCSGNTYMIDKEIPPHITLAVFDAGIDRAELIERLDKVLSVGAPGELQWVSVGVFLPQVLFLVPVLNEYLHNLSVGVCDALAACNHTYVQNCYRPFNWLPHTTVGRTLSDSQMRKAFVILQKNFAPFQGRVVRIGLSEAAKKKEIKCWNYQR